MQYRITGDLPANAQNTGPEQLSEQLRDHGKEFDYEIFQDAPGGHPFDRMDTKISKESRVKIYKHLAKELKPAQPIQSLTDLQRAGYRF